MKADIQSVEGTSLGLRVDDSSAAVRLFSTRYLTSHLIFFRSLHQLQARKASGLEGLGVIAAWDLMDIPVPMRHEVESEARAP